jgi:hypothetical protein
MWGVGLAALIIWLAGTFVLDWIGAADWVYGAWLGFLFVGWIIGGNILYFHLRGGPTRRDWFGLGGGVLMIIVALGVIIEKWETVFGGLGRR